MEKNMRISSILITFFCAISAIAQTTQTGIIKEYNEKAKKTPLAGVELNVRSANSTVSDKNGNFTLQFLSLKPGEKINVRRIEKLGYEVFNKEAVEQWNLNPKDPFVIVMCRSDKFKKIRDNYEKVSSESYARQLKKEEATLAKLKEQGKIKEAEYQQKLYELRENYEKQLDNLDNYVDRFSRIDLSELSAIEQEIIALVQEGRIDEAIAKYEQQNFVDKYAQEVAQIKEVSSAIDRLAEVKQSKEASKDSLLAAIDRQIETLKLAGGKENFDRVGIILSELVEADKQNKQLLWKYIEFLDSQQLIADLDNCILSYLDLNLSNEEKIEALRLRVKTKINETKYDEADSIISEIMTALAHQDNINISPSKKANMYFTIGGLYMDSNHPELAAPFMKKAIEEIPYMGSNMDIEDLDVILKTRVGMGYIAEEIGNEELFKEMTDSVYSIVEPLIDKGYNFESYPDILKSLVDLGQLEEINREYDKAKRLYDYTESQYIPLMRSNPVKFKPAYLNLLMAKAIFLYRIQEYEESEKAYLEGLNYIDQLAYKSPQKYKLYKKINYNNLSTLYLKTDRPDKAIEAAKNAYDIVLDFYSQNPFFYEVQFRSANTSLARVYEAVEDFDEAEKYYLKAQEINKKILGERGSDYEISYWIYTLDPALFYANIGHEELGLPYYEELIEIGDKSIKEGDRLFDALQAIKLMLARGYRKTGDYSNAEKAVESYLAVYPERPNGIMEYARIKAYLGKKEEAKEYVEQAQKLDPDILNTLTEDDIIKTVIE